jgi:hypothetical protein
LLTLLAVGCVDRGAPDAPSPPATVVSASLRAVPDDPSLFERPGGAEVSLAKTHFLWVRLEVLGDLPRPAAWVTLRLYAPSGALHLERRVPFSNDSRLERVPSRSGVGHEIEVSRPLRTGGGWALDMPILVAGSNLERRPQPGAWTVTASLDDRPEVSQKTIVRFVQP